jgi:hypothetical protein
MPEELTPHKKRLFIHLLSLEVVPAKCEDGVGNVVGFFTGSKEDRHKKFEGAKAKLSVCINALRAAADPNPYKDADDETICKRLMEEIDKRHGVKR